MIDIFNLRYRKLISIIIKINKETAQNFVLDNNDILFSTDIPFGKNIICENNNCKNIFSEKILGEDILDEDILDIIILGIEPLTHIISVSTIDDILDKRNIDINSIYNNNLLYYEKYIFKINNYLYNINTQVDIKNIKNCDIIRIHKNNTIHYKKYLANDIKNLDILINNTDIHTLVIDDHTNILENIIKENRIHIDLISMYKQRYITNNYTADDFYINSTTTSCITNDIISNININIEKIKIIIEKLEKDIIPIYNKFVDEIKEIPTVDFNIPSNTNICIFIKSIIKIDISLKRYKIYKIYCESYIDNITFFYNKLIINNSITNNIYIKKILSSDINSNTSVISGTLLEIIVNNEDNTSQTMGIDHIKYISNIFENLIETYEHKRNNYDKENEIGYKKINTHIIKINACKELLLNNEFNIITRGNNTPDTPNDKIYKKLKEEMISNFESTQIINNLQIQLMEKYNTTLEKMIEIYSILETTNNITLLNIVNFIEYHIIIASNISEYDSIFTLYNKFDSTFDKYYKKLSDLNRI